MQYLYRHGDDYVVMDQDTFEQLSLSGALLGDTAHYLKENMDVTVVFYEGRPIAVELPNAVELEVVETAPGVRGDTVSGGSKPVRLETGVWVRGHTFGSVGDCVEVDT